MQNLPFILDQEFASLKTILQSWDEPDYRLLQIWQGIYQQLWSSADQFSSLPKPLRQKLATELSFTHLNPIKTLASTDEQTTKVLFKMPDNALLETVLMRYNKRRSLCISTQVGCAMGCQFCATGQMGFRRNLSSGEIIEQVLFFARQLALEKDHLTNIIVMGMGEPFHNYDATFQAIDLLNDPNGFNFGARRFTVSTVGLIPAIEKFTRERRQVNLAVSLHAADDILRSSLLPINRKYPLNSLFSACLEYVKETHRRITFEWALIDNVNDTLDQAEKLTQQLRMFRIHGSTMCHVNVIQLNPTHGYRGRGTSREKALIFKSYLEEHGIPCTIRLRRGIDIQAGCGQLATLNKDS